MNPDFWRQIGDMGQNWDSFGTVSLSHQSGFRSVFSVQYVSFDLYVQD